MRDILSIKGLPDTMTMGDSDTMTPHQKPLLQSCQPAADQGARGSMNNAAKSGVNSPSRDGSGILDGVAEPPQDLRFSPFPVPHDDSRQPTADIATVHSLCRQQRAPPDSPTRHRVRGLQGQCFRVQSWGLPDRRSRSPASGVGPLGAACRNSPASPSPPPPVP